VTFPRRRPAPPLTPAPLLPPQMAPLGDRLLVKPKAAEEKTAGGILLASSSAPKMDDAHIGTVVAVGEDADVGVKVGDMVLFTKYGSSDIEVPDGEVCFVAQKSILAKLA
jgi:chaperonin GroES